MSRSGLSVLVCAALLSLSVTAAPTLVAGAVGLPAAASQTEAFDEATAAGLAQSLGHRIEVSALRSETDQVFENPDGTTTREQHLEPVRVRRAAAWVPVDSTLTRTASGSLVPAASAVGMVFSGGGTGPLVSVGYNGVGFSLVWPTRLPAPSVSGDTATYSEVYPGVDLTLTAVGTSYTEHLVVKTAAAGRLLAVRSLSLGTQVTGGKLVPAAGGGFTVVDRAGQAVWSSPAPLMWDSSSDVSAAAVAPMGITAGTGGSPAGSRLGQDGAREGDKVTALGQQIGSASMLLTADTTLLDSATTVYPVIIDPVTKPAARYNWAMVDKSYPTTAYYNFADSDQGVGYQNYSGVDTKRLFFGFATTPFFGKTVTNAILYMRETYSGACTAGTVDAYLTGSIPNTGVMTWDTQAARVSGILSSFSVKAGRSDCLPGGYPAEFDVTGGIKSRVASRYVVSTIGLAGRTETTNSSWMRFAGPKNATLAYQPYLSVTYTSPPNTPSTSTMRAPGTGNACASTVAASVHLNQKLPSSWQYSTASDPDGGNLQLVFTLFNAATNAHQNDRATNWQVTNPGVGAVFQLKIPSTWGDGSYYWVAQAFDGTTGGPVSGKCFITLDSKAPPAPALTSTLVQDTLYKADATGNFTMATPDATAFVYSWNGGPETTVAPNTTVPVPSAPLTTMPAWKGDISLASFSAVGMLRVYAVDAAGNRSEASPDFYVRKEVGEKVAQYLFEDAITNGATDGVDTAVDPTEAPHLTFDLAIADGVSWEAGRYASVPTCLNTDGTWSCLAGENLSRSFAGATGAEAVSSEPPVLSAHSFSIGAWIQLSDKLQPRTLIAQDLDAATSSGTNSGIAAYDIGYEPSTNRFVFEVTPVVGQPVQAFDDLPQSSEWHSGAWVYLAAIYDEAAGTIRLDAAREPVPVNPNSSDPVFVPGVPVHLAPGASVKAGLGSFRLGGGAGRAPWSGLVDNVSVWQQVLSDSEVDNQVLFNAEDQR